MKCPNCGSNLAIDDEKCLFCGRPNTFAVKHRREMKHFTYEFNRTKEKVMRESRNVNYWAAKITLIAVLVAANVAIMFFNTNSYGVERFFVRRNIEANYHTYKEKLDELEANREFIAFNKYYEIHRLYQGDKMDEYDKVQTVCSYYTSVYENVMELATEDLDYDRQERQLEFIAQYMGYMYKEYLPDEYADEEKYKPAHQECMKDAVDQIENVIQTYFNLTDEEIASFESLSNARRQILMEEGMLRNE